MDIKIYEIEGNDMKSTISQRLTLLRQEKDISQRQAAKALGVSQALLSHYENGARKPGLAFICAACDYYDVTADYMLGRSLTRHGEVIRAETVPSAADQKDNIVRGVASAMMHKKLIINTTSVLFDILGRTQRNDLVKAAAQYLELSFYKLFRLLYASNEALPQNVFAVDSLIYQQVADAQIKNAETDLCVLLSELETPPDMGFDALAAEFPQFSPSLISLLNNVGKRANGKK